MPKKTVLLDREYVGILAGYRLLTLSVIEASVVRLQMWSRHWRRWKQGSPARYAELLQRTQEADDWLLEEGEPWLSNKVTFFQLCDHLGLEVEEAREQIYGRCDSAALHELWSSGAARDTNNARGDASSPASAGATTMPGDLTGEGFTDGSRCENAGTAPLTPISTPWRDERRLLAPAG
jgi:hypothetical protein